MKTQVAVEKGNYTFNASAKTVTFTGLGTLSLKQILLIVNTTTGATLFQFNDSSLIGTLAANVLTLNNSADWSGAQNTDELAIFINDITYPQKTGYNLVKASANFTRPADTTTYAIGDAISNSTSAPSVFQLDLGALGAVNGQAIEIRKLAVVSSVKQSLLPFFNVYLSGITFTATNDNSPLDIDDTTMQTDGSWFFCDLQNFTASNSRAAYIGAAQPMVLASGDSKLYGAIQAANAYIPVSGETFYIIAWVALL